MGLGYKRVGWVGTKKHNPSFFGHKKMLRLLGLKMPKISRQISQFTSHAQIII